MEAMVVYKAGDSRGWVSAVRNPAFSNLKSCPKKKKKAERLS